MGLRAIPQSSSNRRGSGCGDRKSTRLNSSHTVIYTLSLHDALPICPLGLREWLLPLLAGSLDGAASHPSILVQSPPVGLRRSEEHTSELQSHSDLHSFPTRRSSDLPPRVEGVALAPARGLP